MADPITDILLAVHDAIEAITVTSGNAYACAMDVPTDIWTAQDRSVFLFPAALTRGAPKGSGKHARTLQLVLSLKRTQGAQTDSQTRMTGLLADMLAIEDALLSAPRLVGAENGIAFVGELRRGDWFVALAANSDEGSGAVASLDIEIDFIR